MNGCPLPVLRIVVFAAGLSTRLGRPKALARVHGLTLLRRTLDVVRPFAAGSRIIVVVPPGAGRFRIAASGHPVAFVANPRRAAGMSSSVRAGVRRARYSAGILVLPVDLVHLTQRDMARLIQRWHGSRRKVAARCIHGGPAAPLVLPHWLYIHARGLQGDHGLRDVLRRLPKEALSLVALPSAESDIDTPGDLERARRRARRGF